MSGYTKGPWQYRPNPFDDWGFVRGGRDGFLVAVARGGDETATFEDSDAHRSKGTDPYEANARLIAAAPELFEALKALIYAGNPECDDPRRESTALFQAGPAALAKAEGKEAADASKQV